MSVSNFEGSTENLFNFEPSQAGVENNSALIFEEITRKLEAYLSKESNDEDSTDGIFDLLSSISDSVPEEFDELSSGDTDNKRFFWALPRYLPCFSTQKLTLLKK